MSHWRKPERSYLSWAGYGYLCAAAIALGVLIALLT